MAFRNRNGELQNNNRADNSNVNAKNCFVCKRICSNTCAKCGEYYCSRKCQTADWPDHKYVCFKMPDLIMGPAGQNQNHVSAKVDDQPCNSGLQNGFNKSENSSVRSTSESQVNYKNITFADAPKSNDDVILLYVKQANTYYIRTCISSMEYNKNARDFDQNGRNGERIREIPKRNDVLLVKHRGKFVRGLVLKPDSEAEIEVALIDIGSTAKIALNDMRVINDDLYQRKRYNYKLTIESLGAGVEATQFKKLLAFSKNQTVFTIKFEGDDYTSGKNFKLIEKFSRSPIEVLLQSEEKESDVEQGAALATKKVQESLEPEEVTLETNSSAKAVTPPKIKLETNKSAKEVTPPKIMLKDLTFVKLPEVANLVILDDSTVSLGCVSVIAQENVEKLDELHAKVQNIASAIQEVYEPEDDEICLVLYKEEWYRAHYAPPNCILIDYGNSEIVDKKDIRKLPVELNDPCYTLFCHIQDFTAERFKKVKKTLETQFAILTVHTDCEVINCKCNQGDNDPNEYDVTFPIIEELLE